MWKTPVCLQEQSILQKETNTNTHKHQEY